MKKKEFDGIALAVVEKFKAPIEKFNSIKDFQNWAGSQARIFAGKDYGGRQRETQIQRKSMLKEWADYVLKENEAYTGAIALLVLASVTKGLKPDNDKLPPVLNKGILADCIYEIDRNTRADKKYGFDLNKMYETKLRASYISDSKTGETETKWVVIPSRKHDPENFQANVEKLKTLSYKNWCTKSFNAEPYLARGDFHVYLENGEPQIGIRFVGDMIKEIQGRNNNNRIPFEYLELVDKYIKDNKFNLTEFADYEIDKAYSLKDELEKAKIDLKDAIENNDFAKIFLYFGVDFEEDYNGRLILPEYNGALNEDFSYTDIGIDENKLFKRVKKIKGNAEFRNSRLKSLHGLETIGGNAYFGNSSITDLGDLAEIDGNADFGNSSLKSLGKLKSIRGDAYFNDSLVTDLGDLSKIGGNARFENSLLQSLGKLKSIGQEAYFENSQIKDLGGLEFVGWDIYIDNSSLKEEDFKNVKIMERECEKRADSNFCTIF